MPKISVIVPVYNVEKYLSECLDSIINQTFPDFEIICVNDCSTDKSGNILEDYSRKDNRIKIFYHQFNQGLGAARNTGLKNAHGKYVQFLDSDDYFELTLLEEMYNHAEKYGADMTVCSINRIGKEGNIINYKNPNSPIDLDKTPLETPFCWKDYKKDIFSMFNVAVWNKLYLKEMLVNNNLTFPDLTSCEDVAFGYISRICAKKICVFNKKLVNYRQEREGSLIQSKVNHALNIIKAAENTKDFLTKKGIYEKLKESFINAVKKHLERNIKRCDDEQYQIFEQTLKSLMPEEWNLFWSVLRKNNAMLEYIKKSTRNKKIMLWGASLFIKEVLEKETERNPNILGIIDRNTECTGKTLGNYNIYPPDMIHKLKPDGIILTVLHNNKSIYESLKQEFKEKYHGTELLPNIFEEQL